MATAELQGRQALDVVPSGQLVTFTLDDVEFGMDIDRVQEITPRTTITPVPGSPSFVLGIVNLRGSIIPVLDSRLRFHLPPRPPTPRTRIIILDLAGQPTGLMVDSVSEVVKLDDFTLRETPPLVAGVRSDYLAGMVTAANRLITLVNLDKILDSAEFGQRERLVERAGETRALGAGGSALEAQEEVEEDLPVRDLHPGPGVLRHQPEDGGGDHRAAAGHQGARRSALRTGRHLPAGPGAAPAGLVPAAACGARGPRRCRRTW